VSANRQKGTAAETAFVKCLQEAGFIHAERRAGNGRNDRGDVTGIPGLVIEVKCHKTIDLADWVDEMLAEKANADAEVGAVTHKRRGKANPLDWYVTMTGADFLVLLRAWQFDES
jgi:Holliday junction resolvase